MIWNLSSIVPEVSLPSSEIPKLEQCSWEGWWWNGEWCPWEDHLVPFAFLSEFFWILLKFCISFRIHFSFEDIWEWGWLVRVRTEWSSFVNVFISAAQHGGLGSEPWGLSNPWYSLPRILPLLLNLICPIKLRVLWEIQEGSLRGRQICSLADDVMLSEFCAQFSVSSTIYLLVNTSVHEGDCVPQSLEACISPVFWWRLNLVSLYCCLAVIFPRAVRRGLTPLMCARLSLKACRPLYTSLLHPNEYRGIQSP